MERLVLLCACFATFLAPAVVLAEGGKRPLKLADMFAFKRVADPQISPDGKLVVYVITAVDLAANKSSSTLWISPSDKSEPRQLTTTTKKDSHPRWSPDGKQILFESSRSGEQQLWVIDLLGGEARQLTTISSEAGNGIWAPDGKSIAFVSAVYPEFSDKPFKESDALNKKRKEEIEASPVKAKVHTKLFYRHWDSYVEDKRQHLFVMPAIGGEPKDVTPGDRDAFPTSDTFAAGDNFTFTPDSHHLVFTGPPLENEAWSTDYNLFRVSIEGGKVECLTADNKAADSGPQFSPDGTRLAYRAQKRPGFEADQWELMVVECDASGAFKNKPKSLLDAKQSIGDFVWARIFTGPGSGPGILFAADDNGAVSLFGVALDGTSVIPVFRSAGVHGSLSASRDGTQWAFTLARMFYPPEVFVSGGDPKKGLTAIAISRVNEKLLAEIELPHPESVNVPVGGAMMQMWILKPPGFDEKKKWPLVYLVHGGPQGAWEDGWSYRWNPELWAAQGYVVAMPNPRGSTGFGQKFVDEISGDWGGKCFDDLMKGMDYLEKLPYIDKERMAAAGASFGGYMMNWFEGHTNRFKTLISHCGVYNFDSMYATTEEIWFDEWEHGGPPWGTDRSSYEKYSPHRYAKDFKTPMLIISNDLDFRVPVSEGQQLFTTLQRLKIPSRFINFPDEGHWVLKPKNSEYWHKEVFAWLAKYAPPGGR
jgi:dipeptidyl aminopeptidase/acylaminoacyl peptidase